MIRIFDRGYEHYKCSRCGETVYKDDEYCPLCGHHFNSVQNETILDNTALEDETICVVAYCQKRGVFTFTQLKVDTTPKHLRNNPNWRLRMIGVNYQEFYIFKTDKYPYLREGQQINLNLNYYDNCRTTSYKINYDKRHFSLSDINELKIYSFGGQKIIEETIQGDFTQSDFTIFKEFYHKWDREFSFEDKKKIAEEADVVNNIGYDFFIKGSFHIAIDCFNQALQIMPINSDSLKNLVTCYTLKEKYEMAIKTLKKLNYLSITNFIESGKDVPLSKQYISLPKNVLISKIIAYSLLLNLIEDFDDNLKNPNCDDSLGGAITSSDLISFIEENFGIITTINEIDEIMKKINQENSKEIIIKYMGITWKSIDTNGTYKTSFDLKLSMLKQAIEYILYWEKD